LGSQIGMPPEPVELVRLLEQRERAVADQVRSRLMTRDEQQQAGANSGNGVQRSRGNSFCHSKE